MIKFAKLTTENKVENVLVFHDTYDGDTDTVEQLFSGKFVQVTDPAGNFVGNATKQPKVGAEYTNDHFVDPQPFPSWVLNGSYEWEPPVAQPNPGDLWDEDNLSWYSQTDGTPGAATATHVPTGPTVASLHARLSALEADEINDDAASNALLTLIADLTARVSALES